MLNMSSEYSYCSEGGFDEMSSSSDSGFDVSFESPKHDSSSPGDLNCYNPANVATLAAAAGGKDEKRKKTRNARSKSPTQVSITHRSIPIILLLLLRLIRVSTSQRKDSPFFFLATSGQKWKLRFRCASAFVRGSGVSVFFEFRCICAKRIWC